MAPTLLEGRPCSHPRRRSPETSVPPTSSFPPEPDRVVLQCAWCWAVADPSGTYGPPTAGPLSEATHGICPACKTALLQEIDASPYLWDQLRRGARASVVQHQAAAGESGPITRITQVLVVDDDPAIRDVLSDVLTMEGYTVATAENGQAGLEQLQRARPDLILLDLLMPGMDGWTFARQCRADPAGRDIPIVVLSAAV